jgi:hypothetical protein
MIKNLRPTLAEAGKIKIGGLSSKKTRSGHRLPEKHDSFTVTTTQRDEKGDLIQDARIMEALGESPKEIPIVVHSDRIEEIFPTRYARYQGRALACSGDGETATDKHGELLGCPCEHLAKKRCKPSGTLYCSLALPGHAVAGAVHKWRTTSMISIQQMIGSLQHIEQMVGVLRGIPLTLRMGPIQVSPGGTETTVYVCWVELRAADVYAVQQQALETERQRTALQAALRIGSNPDYRELVAASESAETDPDAPEHYTEPEPIEVEVVEPTEHPRDAVLRIGKGLGLSRKEITEIVKAMKLPSADEWTDETVAKIKEVMEANKK